MKRNNYLCLLSILLVFNSLTFVPQNHNEIFKDNVLKTNLHKAPLINVISTKEDFLEFLNQTNSDAFSKNKAFEITNDIDLEGEIIKPISIFAGSLNGNNHCIKNFEIDSSSSGNETGFIRVLTETGNVKNLSLDYQIEVKNDNTAVGGFIGTNKGMIENCTFLGKIKGRHIVGGIAGINEKGATIVDSKNNGNIVGKIFAAGICGVNKGTIKSSINSGIINQERFSSTDEITISNIGGIVGFNQFKIEDCTNNGEVGRKQVGTFVGGIAGASLGEINNCSNYGIIKGDTNIGGIVGSYAEFSKQDKNQTFNDLIDLIENILNNKNNENLAYEIKDESSLKSSSLKFCLNLGLVSGDNAVGGIAGYSANALNAVNKRVFDINNCVNVSQVEASKNELGGIVGNQLNGKIYECFNVGNIHGKTVDYVGGIAGKSGGEIAYSFSINDMVGNKYVGGLVGSGNEIHDCYTICKIDTKNVFNGAIAGEVKELNDKIFDNYYVNDDYYGIDNIDYQNKTTKLNKDQLASVGELSIKLNPTYYSVDQNIKSYPILTSFLELNEDISNNKLLKDSIIEATKFGSYVNFLNEDGSIIKKILVGYNEDLDPSQIPEVPQKEGYFVRWSDFDPNGIVTNLYIKPIYDEIVTTIASSKGPMPTVLIEGKFYNTTKLTATVNEINILDKKSKYSFIKTVTIDLSDDINQISRENIKVKISLPDKYEKALVGIKDGDGIKVLESKIDGRYIVFDAQETNEYYILDQKFANWNNPWFIVTITCSIVGGLALIGGITFGIIHHIKKKKLKM